MGGGIYSSVSRATRSDTLGYETKSRFELFSRDVHNDMNPSGIELREARDSADHPCSVPVIIALDVTGSMGSVPHELLKSGLPTIMDTIFEKGIKDPQIMFVAVGDHECDRHPLQISQFESSDEKLDSWLQKVYLEGGGGGNDGESYLLPWMFTKVIKTDHMEKRGKKGILITIGDEKCLPKIGARDSKNIFGVDKATTAVEALEEARKEWKVFHIHVVSTNAGARNSTQSYWKELDLDGVKFAVGDDVARTIARIVSENADVAIDSTAQVNSSGGVMAGPSDEVPSDVEGPTRPNIPDLENDIPVSGIESGNSSIDDLPEPL